MRVLIVDDSVVYRTQIRTVLETLPGVDIVGAAKNGQVALQMLETEQVDLMTLDIEMPVMNGIETLKALQTKVKAPRVIVFTAHNRTAADIALQALHLGAVDFITKPNNVNSLVEGLDFIRSELQPKIQELAIKMGNAKWVTDAPKPNKLVSTAEPGVYTKRDVANFTAQAIVIGSSTGGPAALEKFFEQARGFVPRVPVFIAQHMPPLFTASLAQHLSQAHGFRVTEGQDGEVAEPGHVYVAPGDFHMTLSGDAAKPVIHLDQSERRNFVRPAVDYLFESVAAIYAGKTLGFVLTGMGEDGKAGSVAIKKAGGAIVIQDAASSVVWGMPGAVHKSGAYDSMGDLTHCSQLFIKQCSRK